MCVLLRISTLGQSRLGFPKVNHKTIYFLLYLVLNIYNINWEFVLRYHFVWSLNSVLYWPVSFKICNALKLVVILSIDLSMQRMQLNKRKHVTTLLLHNFINHLPLFSMWANFCKLPWKQFASQCKNFTDVFHQDDTVVITE